MSDQFSPVEENRFIDERYGAVESATTPPSMSYVNESGLPDELVEGAFRADRKLQQEIASQVEQWTQSLNPVGPTRSLDLFARQKWDNATHPFAVMSMCAWAVENDDVLLTLADVTEGLTFKKMRFELNDEDQQDMWNQWAEDVDLDSRMREMFRDLYKFSQVYVGLWWEQKAYRVRDSVVSSTVADMQRLRAAQIAAAGDPNAGATPPPPPPASPGRGNRRRKKVFPVEIPTAMTVFDPTKILPVGTLMFGRERFAYIATEAEDDAFGKAMAGEVVDPTVLQLIEQKYTPTGPDIQACRQLGIEPTRLWLMKKGSIFRHTLTRAQYERFPAFRLKPALEIVNLKSHLRNADRAALIGNTNFIVVITKGTDKWPAKPVEIDNLREQARVIARLPVLVGDHRLNVDIVAPKLDNTLMETRWSVLDSRLVFSALRSFQPIMVGGQTGAGSGVSEMSRVISQGLENRRHQLIRAIERYVFKEVLSRNEAVLSEAPNLAFAPKRVTLDFSTDIINAILKLRDRGDVSRETMLDEFDYDQDVEVVRRAREHALYDDVFNSSTPFNSPDNNPFGAQNGGTQNGQPSNSGPAPAPAGTSPEGGRPAGARDTQPRKPAGTGGGA